MRKLIVSEFLTLDGVMEAPGGEPTHPHTGWVFDFFGPEHGEYKLAEILEAESLLIGRVTYEGFAEVWPSRQNEFADKMNEMPKHVASTTLTELGWTTRRCSRARSRRRSGTSSRPTAGQSSWPAAAPSCTR